MIVYPIEWEKDYEHLGLEADAVINELMNVLSSLHVRNIAYSGGIDSSIVLCMLSMYSSIKIHTYTIASREDHPDIIFARMGSEKYNTIHHEFIVDPNNTQTDKFNGDNVVRQFFENIKNYTDEIICCDGIDEFMCGYYDHMDESLETYAYYLSRLSPDHLAPLNKNSGSVKVYLPYLDDALVDIYNKIPLHLKISKNDRKLIMKDIARKLKIPNEIIDRNKYGFCDAFLSKDKEDIKILS